MTIIDEQAAFELFAAVVRQAHRDARMAYGEERTDAITFLQHLGSDDARRPGARGRQERRAHTRGIAAMSKRDDLTPANRNRRAIRRLTH